MISHEEAINFIFMFRYMIWRIRDESSHQIRYVFQYNNQTFTAYNYVIHFFYLYYVPFRFWQYNFIFTSFAVYVIIFLRFRFETEVLLNDVVFKMFFCPVMINNLWRIQYFLLLGAGSLTQSSSIFVYHC